MYTVKQVVELLVAGKEFSSAEINQIMLDIGMSKEKLNEYRSVKKYDDQKMLGLLRFA